MRSYQSGTIECGSGVVALLEGSVVNLSPGEWARSLFFQKVGEDKLAEELERGLAEDVDIQWFVSKMCTPEGLCSATAVTRGTVEACEQWREFGKVNDWFTSTSKRDPSAVAARLREAKKETVLPESWFAYRSESDPSCWPPIPRPCSPLALAHWAFYLEKRDAMPSEQRLLSLATLARWNPAQAFMHAYADLKKDSPLFSGDDYSPDLFATRVNSFQRAVELWLCQDQYGHASLDHRVDRTTWAMEAFLEELRTQLANRTISEAGELYSESQMGPWINSVASEVAKALGHRYRDVYQKCRNRLFSAYFPGSGPWEDDWDTEPHFPVGHRDDFRLNRLEQYDLHKTVWIEEQLVRRFLQLLIDHHVASTGLTHDAVISSMHKPGHTTFSTDEETLYRFYDQALNETVARAAIEQGYDYAWRVACAAITMTNKHKRWEVDSQQRFINVTKFQDPNSAWL
ncbi:hypothetical protein GNI_037510 [Gregarina niphandrodes]|uniref:Uncharacterized protein n=1 Tax=Gregarina niphandrodes TaxID=110365 RepID=A0A023BAN5_GRENI|nr:hypothetical protein GNI_037510 [Gregarina niphandrodes]EZG78353.1 hypothetical protein GNI_037510 [Gregarina niphandrodes]|eukprot:XP_011129333.1 hypothetical protein GNI_037510 [Gregarina niphandrodes]